MPSSGLISVVESMVCISPSDPDCGSPSYIESRSDRNASGNGASAVWAFGRTNTAFFQNLNLMVTSHPSYSNQPMSFGLAAEGSQSNLRSVMKNQDHRSNG